MFIVVYSTAMKREIKQNNLFFNTQKQFNFTRVFN